MKKGRSLAYSPLRKNAFGRLFISLRNAKAPFLHLPDEIKEKKKHLFFLQKFCGKSRFFSLVAKVFRTKKIFFLWLKNFWRTKKLFSVTKKFLIGEIVSWLSKIEFFKYEKDNYNHRGKAAIHKSSHVEPSYIYLEPNRMRTDFGENHPYRPAL